MIAVAEKQNDIYSRLTALRRKRLNYNLGKFYSREAEIALALISAMVGAPVSSGVRQFYGRPNCLFLSWITLSANMSLPSKCRPLMETLPNNFFGFSHRVQNEIHEQ